jgi:hypothetical protein
MNFRNAYAHDGDIFNFYHRNNSRVIAITTMPYIAIPICSTYNYQRI